MENNGDYQELVQTISSRLTKHQLLNAAVIAALVCLLLGIATLFNLVSEAFWQVLVYNIVKATFVLTGLVVFGKMLYQAVNKKVEGIFPPAEDSKKSAEKKTTKTTKRS